MEEEELTDERLLEQIKELYSNRASYIEAMEKAARAVLLT